jgi:hypothetical protein
MSKIHFQPDSEKIPIERTTRTANAYSNLVPRARRWIRVRACPRAKQQRSIPQLTGEYNVKCAQAFLAREQ